MVDVVAIHTETLELSINLFGLQSSHTALGPRDWCLPEVEESDDLEIIQRYRSRWLF